MTSPLVFLVDQYTKHLVLKNIAVGEFIPVIPGLFDLVHARNRGAAFGFMAGLPDHIRGPFFFVVSTLALVMITLYFLKLKDARGSLYVCLGLILGGALGNIWDRVTLGEVVDFLSFHWYDQVANWRFAGRVLRFRWEWPAFNVADMAISIAVFWIIVLMMKQPASETGETGKTGKGETA